MQLSDIRTVVRTLISEATASFWTDSELNNYINYGQNDFCEQTDCLEDISTASTVQYQADYDLPTDYTKIKRVELSKGDSLYYIIPESLGERWTGMVKTTNNPPNFGTIWAEKLSLRERPSNGAQTTTLSGAASTSTTSISIASSSGLPRMGRIIIGSEVILYWANSSDLLTGCERGAEGTTAASHSNADVVTLRDITIYHYKKPATLSSDSDEPEIPSQFHMALAHYAAYLARMKSKDYDLAAAQKQIYDEFVIKGFEWTKFKWKRNYRPI